MAKATWVTSDCGDALFIDGDLVIQHDGVCAEDVLDKLKEYVAITSIKYG